MQKLLIFICVMTLSLCCWQKCFAQEPPFELPDTREIEKIRSAVIMTNKGELVFELFPNEAPWHVANLKFLADKNYFDGVIFSHFYPGYIVQTAPRKEPKWVKYTLPPEFNEHQHQTGALGMARKEDSQNAERRSEPDIIHIVLGKSSHLDGTFTVFGQLVKGFDVLEKLNMGDRIKNVEVFVRRK